nr:cilia- and flagella-associated protein 157-like isoform X2 [Misgurnus anguillicaudatus]
MNLACRYQLKCDKLELQEKDLCFKIDNSEKEKKDIVLYLQHTLRKKEDEVDDLAEALSKHQQVQETERNSFELQLNRLRLELQENKDKFTLENMALASKLASLEEFSAQKEKLMAERKALEEQLQKQKEEHQEEIYRLEKQAVLDKDRVKQEMKQRLDEEKEKLQRDAYQKMPETMMRAMEENRFLAARLKQLKHQNEELLNENDAVKAKGKQLKIENKTSESLLHEITVKNVKNQKVIQQLTEKCKQMQTELEKYVKLQMKHQKLLENHSTVCTELDVLRQNQAAVTEMLQQTKAEVESQRKDLEEERRLGGQLKTVLREAAIALKEALREVPEKDDSEVSAIVRRHQMMQSLLAVLETAVAVGEGPALVEFIPAMGSTKSPNVERSSELLRQKSTNRLSHYKPGDLGLVPRKTQATSSKMGHNK